MEVKISKPSTYNNKTIITYEVFYGFDKDNYQNNYELTIAKWKNRGWGTNNGTFYTIHRA